MGKKQTGWKTKGMNRDLSVSAFNPEFAFENMNLRLSTNDGNTTFSWVNERGPANIAIYMQDVWSKEGEQDIVGAYTDAAAQKLPHGSGPAYTDIADAESDGWSWSEYKEGALKGVPVGTAVIDHKLVLFTTGCGTYTISEGEDALDCIYILWYNDDKTALYCKEYYKGNLNFSIDHPLETNVAYEAEHIQKVYWVDGNNQPRIANIVGDTSKLTDTSFDFVPSIAHSPYPPELKVVKNSSGGLFAPGDIQYCFTYMNKYRQQTNIVEQSTLNYLAYSDRAASPEDRVGNSFNITISRAATDFEYVRLYSIQRTSLDATPIVKVLSDIEITTHEETIAGETAIVADDLTFTDNGTVGYTIDPTELLYVGGKEISALTMVDKDGTLFLGNIEQKNTLVNNIQAYFEYQRDNNGGHLSGNGEISYNYNKEFNMNHTTGIYSHTNTLNNNLSEISTFKGGEGYRFGFQLQKVTGEWTEPIYLEDKTNSLYPQSSVFSDTVKLVTANATINFQSINPDLSVWKPFIRVRPVIVYPNPTDRNVLCQGVLNPTVFNAQDRINNSPFAQASWYFRPYMFTQGSDPTVPVNPGNIIYTMDSRPDYPDLSIGSEFADSTRNVYVVLGDADENGINDIISSGKIKFTIAGTSGYAPLVGIIEFPDMTYLRSYAFVVSSPLPIGDAQHVVDFSQLSNPIYDNTQYTLYSDLEVDDTSKEFFYVGDDSLPTSYVFKFCDINAPGAGNHYFTVTYISVRETDYRILKRDTQGVGVTFTHYASLPAQDGSNTLATDSKEIEIQGSINPYSSPFDQSPTNEDKSNMQYFIDQSIVTLNSPDIEFDTGTQVMGTEGLKLRIVGAVPITANISAHNIAVASSMLETSNKYEKQIKTPLGNVKLTGHTDNEPAFGSGERNYNIIHKNVDICAGQRLVAGNLWNDIVIGKFKVDPSDPHSEYDEERVQTSTYTYNYIIHPWHRSGSLNNDSRPGDSASALLKTKRESNMLFSINSEYFTDSLTDTKKNFEKLGVQIALTENDYVMNYRISKQRDNNGVPAPDNIPATTEINYYPNIDKILYNENGYKPISDYDPDNLKPDESTIPLVDVYTPISMKYKSTSHAIIALKALNTSIPILPRVGSVGSYTHPSGEGYTTIWKDTDMQFNQEDLATDYNALFINGKDGDDQNIHVNLNFLWLGELYTDERAGKFGGNTKEALRNNTWCVAGAAIPWAGKVSLEWTLGDTYYQRYDCLKTYPFTREDPNQLVEILSFMCETRVNIDGRYDRNRGQADNTNMSPQNFNLLNPVYSQRDNFFTARKMDTEDVDKLVYPNQIYYSKTKTNGADVDLWTNVTLASMLELDGDKGSVNKLTRLNDSIIAFQDTGIAQVLFNENVALSVENGVPVEIANSGKVQGKRYLSNTIGCSNKWSVVNTPSGIYFMDSNDKSIYLFNGQLANLSLQGGMNSWCKKNIIASAKWTPINYIFPTVQADPTIETGFDGFVGYYDKKNQDVLFINKGIALAWSERLNTFTSFYDYGYTPYLCSLDDDSIWIKPYWRTESGQIYSYNRYSSLWSHNEGGYCDFFGEKKPYSMTLIGNPEPQLDKIFTNLEFRASVEGDGELNQETGKFTPALPFDFLETWDEYQHGKTALKTLNGHSAFIHGTDPSSLKRKFRIWRCDIPRDNWPVCLMPAPLPENPSQEQIDAYNTAMAAYNEERNKGISRYSRHPVDRMRNPWLYLQLKKDWEENQEVMPKAEIHDILMTYFD